MLLLACLKLSICETTAVKTYIPSIDNVQYVFEWLIYPTTSQSSERIIKMLKEVSLNSYWEFKLDRKNEGLGNEWYTAIPDNADNIWVPSCWNESDEELFDYEGVAWYFRKFIFKEIQDVKRYVLFFYGVNYKCDIWLNGKAVGSHTGGFTPFEIDITESLVIDGENLIAVRVDSEINNMTSPPIGVDWFNYGGIYRDVSIMGTGESWLEDVTVVTKMNGEVAVTIDIGNFTAAGDYSVNLTVDDKDRMEAVYDVTEKITCGKKAICLGVENPKLWSPDSPFLYDFKICLKKNDKPMDYWTHRIGIREFSISNRKVLLNGEVIYLRGYSKHEEYPVTGRTFSDDIVRRDYDLCKKGSANFLRLCHYPHHLKEYEIASETGFLVIAEVPNVNFKKEQFQNPELLELANKQMQDTIKYYKNETCIMFWSLFIECKTYEDAAVDFVPKYIKLAKAMDPTRFVVHASDIPTEDRTYEYFDVVGINYWLGWYNGHTIEDGSLLLDRIAARYPEKPVLMTSGGWEGMYGQHSRKARIKWSEESQADYLESLIDLYVSKDYIIGQIVWTFNDFRVSSWLIDGEAKWPSRPMGINHKGVLDFYRRPKLSYYRLQEAFKKWDEKPV